jgi:hypothetical protein
MEQLFPGRAARRQLPSLPCAHLSSFPSTSRAAGQLAGNPISFEQEKCHIDLWVDATLVFHANDVSGSYVPLPWIPGGLFPTSQSWLLSPIRCGTVTGLQNRYLPFGLRPFLRKVP